MDHGGRPRGVENPGTVRHVGFDPVATVEDALRLAEEIHWPGPSVAVVPYPPAVNRTL